MSSSLEKHVSVIVDNQFLYNAIYRCIPCKTRPLLISKNILFYADSGWSSHKRPPLAQKVTRSVGEQIRMRTYSIVYVLCMTTRTVHMSDFNDRWDGKPVTVGFFAEYLQNYSFIYDCNALLYEKHVQYHIIT